MQGSSLTLRDLRKGDILLVEDLKDPTHLMIGIGQAIMSHGTRSSSNVTHAGLYDGGISILEASGGEGLRSAEFFEKHRGTKYQVYRYRSDPDVAELAAQWAQRLVDKRGGETRKTVGFGRYDTPGALSSLLAPSTRGPLAKKAIAHRLANPDEDRGFYCSSFVVECYEVACELLRKRPVLEVDYRYISPKMLQANLRHGTDWAYKGN